MSKYRMSVCVCGAASRLKGAMPSSSLLSQQPWDMQGKCAVKTRCNQSSWTSHLVGPWLPFTSSQCSCQDMTVTTIFNTSLWGKDWYCTVVGYSVYIFLPNNHPVSLLGIISSFGTFCGQKAILVLASLCLSLLWGAQVPNTCFICLLLHSQVGHCPKIYQSNAYSGTLDSVHVTQGSRGLGG